MNFNDSYHQREALIIKIRYIHEKVIPDPVPDVAKVDFEDIKVTKGSFSFRINSISIFPFTGTPG